MKKYPPENEETRTNENDGSVIIPSSVHTVLLCNGPDHKSTRVWVVLSSDHSASTVEMSLSSATSLRGVVDNESVI